MFHLTNLTPRVNKKCTKHQNSTENKTKKINHVEKSTYITCKGDLLEIITKEFRDSIEYNRNFTFNIDLNKTRTNFIKSSTVAWKPTTYLSTGSFETNKNISYCSDKQQNNYFTNGSLKKMNKVDVNFLNLQKRFFKTYRALIAENQRNPTILSRLKEAYNQPSSSGTKRLETLNPASQTKQTIQHESLSKLLNQFDTNLTTEQKHQLKLAFAEGYLAASQPESTEKGGKAIKYLKVSHLYKLMSERERNNTYIFLYQYFSQIVQQLLMIIIITAIMVSLFTSNNGSVFR